MDENLTNETITDVNGGPGAPENRPGAEPSCVCDAPADGTPVLAGGQPVFRTVQLFDGNGQPVCENGEPVFRLVQRVYKDGKHSYVSVDKITEPDGTVKYVRGNDYFACESDMPLEAQQAAVTSQARLEASVSATAGGRKMPGVLAPETAPEEKATSSAYSRAGFSLAVLSQVYPAVTQMILIAGSAIALLLPMILSGSFNLSKLAGDLSGGKIFDFIAESPALPYIIWIYAIASALGMIAGIAAQRLVISNRHISPIPRKKLGFGKFILFAVLCYGVWAVGVYIGHFADLFFPVNTEDALSKILEDAGPLSLPIHVYAIIGAPFFEELACRKMLIDRLHKYGQVPAMIVSALLFGLLHGNSGQFFLAFFLGLLFAVIYMKTGNIFYSMGLHFMINLTASIPDFVYWAGVDISPYLYFVFMPAMAAAALVLFLIFRKKEIFRLTPSVCERSAMFVFRNPGMLIAVIGGTVLLAATDFMNKIAAVQTGNYWNLLGLISTVLVVLAVFLSIVFTAKARTKR